MKFRFISENRKTFKIGHMCKVLKVSCTGFYAWLKRPESRRSLENRFLEQQLRAVHKDSNMVYGSPKIHRELNEQGIRCGKNRVARIMRKTSIKSKTKRKFKATTNSRHSFPVAPNLFQNFDVDTPNKCWVTDLTYIPTAQGWLYLATLMDWYSRRIIGWSMDKRMSRHLTIDTLK